MSPRDTVRRVLERMVAALSAMIVAMAVVSITSVLLIQREVTQTAQQITPMVDVSAKMRITLTDAQATYRAFLLTSDGGYLVLYEDLREEYEQHRAKFNDLAGALDPAVVDGFESACERWFERADAEIALMAEDKPADVTRSAVVFDEVVAAHDDLVAEVTRARAEKRKRYRLFMNGSILGTSLATVAALFVTRRQSRLAVARLARPLQHLYQVVTRHERGTVESRADTTKGAQEVVAVASAFNALADRHQVLQQERERTLELHRMTGSVAARLSWVRDGGWDAACGELARGLGVDGVAIYEVTESGPVALGGWYSPEAEWDRPLLGRVAVTDLAARLVDAPVLRASTAEEIRDAFPEDLRRVADQLGVRAWVLHPLVLVDDALGVLSVARAEEHTWEPAELDAIRRVADYATHTLAERRHVESLEDLDRQKSDFMATTSHELRTPLTSIAGYLEMLEDGDFGPLAQPQSKALDVVARNVTRLRALIDDLLLLNRLDSGQAATSRRTYDVRDSVAVVVESLVPVASSAGVALAAEVGDSPAWVLADRDQLERALGNLVSNGIKFTPKGGSVDLRAEVTDETVRLSCSDTGMGIPEDELGRMFTRFYRASNAQEGHVQGTGLGLVIVQTIAELHGGSADLTSAEGEGTTVTITLPLASPDQRPASAGSGASPGSPRS